MLLLEQIELKLREAFDPIFLEIEDFSHMHKGHKEVKAFLDNQDVPTHIKVSMVALAFNGLSRLECQRKVYAVLGEEIFSSIHAVTLSLSTPKGKGD